MPILHHNLYAFVVVVVYDLLELKTGSLKQLVYNVGKNSPHDPPQLEAHRGMKLVTDLGKFLRHCVPLCLWT